MGLGVGVATGDGAAVGDGDGDGTLLPQPIATSRTIAMNVATDGGLVQPRERRSDMGAIVAWPRPQPWIGRSVRPGGLPVPA